jgi:hypothetical protein
VVGQQIETGLGGVEAASQSLRAAIDAQQRRAPLISLINESTIPADWSAIGRALEIQLRRDFAPVWHTDGGAIVLTTRALAHPDSWWLVILNDSDQAGALGYHQWTATGQALGKVFAATDRQYNLSSSVTASHELLEMAADPDVEILRGVLTYNGQNRIYACEICDPVEADALGYQINGVPVSDFVTPAWFRPGAPGPYSFRGNVHDPLQLARGGYISWLADLTQGWQQSTAQTDVIETHALMASVAGGNPRFDAQPGSRRDRRQTDRNAWRNSAPA